MHVGLRWIALASALSLVAGCSGNGGTWCQDSTDEMDLALHPDVSNDAIAQAFHDDGWEDRTGFEMGERGLTFEKKIWDAKTGELAFHLSAWSVLLPEEDGTSGEWIRVRLGLHSTQSTSPEDPRAPPEIENVEAAFLPALRALGEWRDHPGNRAQRAHWEDCVHAD